MSNGKDIKVGITFTGDGSGLRSEVKVSAADFDKLKGSAAGAGETASQSFKKMSLAQADYAKKSAAFKALDIRTDRDIRHEISLVTAAHKRLAVSGSASSGELARAHVKTRNRVADLKREMAGLPQAGSGVGALTGRVMALAGAWLSVRGAMAATDASDTFVGVNARLINAVKSTEEFAIAQTELQLIAKDTRAEWAGTVDLYSRMSRSTQDLEIAQSDLLTVTTAINQAGKVSGATNIEQSNALIQLGQAFASGVLRGDEFRSMNEQMPRVVRMMADGMGVAYGDMRALAEDGKLTTDVLIKAIVKEAGTVDKEFKRMPVTVGDARVQISNEMVKMIGDFGKTSGSAETLAKGLMTIADQIKYIPEYLPEIAVGLAAVGAQAVVARVGLSGLTISLASATLGAKALGKALLPLAAAEGVFKIFELGSEALSAYEAHQNSAGAATRGHATAMKVFKEKLLPARAELASLGLSMNEFAGKLSAEEFDKKVLKMVAALNNMRRAKVNPESANDEPSSPETPEVKPIDPALAKKSLDDARALTNQLSTAFDDTFTKTSDKYSETWQQLVDTHGEGSAEVKALESSYQSWLDSTWDNQLRVAKSASDKVVGLQAAKYARINQAAAENAATDEDRALMRLDSDLKAMDDERQRLIDQNNWTDALEASYAEAKISRAQATADQLGVIADEETAKVLERLIAGETAAYNIKGQLNQAFSRDQKVNQMAMLGNIQAFSKASADWEKWSGEQKVGFAAATFGALSGLMASENRKLFEVGKLAAHSENVIHTALGATKAISTLGPIAGPIAAIAITAAGVANSQVIQGQKFNGGGGAVSVPTISAGGGGGDTQATVAVDPATGLPSWQQNTQPVVNNYYYTTNNNLQNSVGGIDFYRSVIKPAIKEDVNANGEVMFEPGTNQSRVLADEARLDKAA